MFEDLEAAIIDAVVVARLFGEYHEQAYEVTIMPMQFNPIKLRLLPI